MYADWGDFSTGFRLKALRGRELTQEQLAAKAGLSVATVQKAEQDKGVALATLMKLANALSVDIAVIQGHQAPRKTMEQADRSVMRELSSAVHDTAVGLLPETAVPSTVEELRALVDRCWEVYWKGQYTEAGAIAAPLVLSAAATVREQPAGRDAAAWGVLSDAYRISAYVSNLGGNRELAYAAIGHAQEAAQKAADDIRQALVASGRAWVYLRDARLPEALRLAEKSAADIEPQMSRATPEHRTAYGSHVNFAAVVASRMGNKERAADFLSQSHATAALLGREVRAYGTLFGPTTAETQAVGVNISLGNVGKAMSLIGDIEDVSGLTKAARSRYAMDKALTLAEAEQWDACLDTLEEALTQNPAWAKYQQLPAVILRKVGEGSTAQLRRVSALLGVSPLGSGGFSPATAKSAL